MSNRRSLSLPITLGVIMLVLLVVLMVGWVLLAVFGAMSDAGYAGLYWTLLSVGAVFLIVVIIGTSIYLWLSIQLTNLSRRQSNFIDSVTHELKSPLASLKLYLQTLRRRPVNEQQRSEFYRLMLDDCERLDQLINHLLDAASLERETSDDESEDVEFAPLLAELAKQVCARHQVSPGAVALDVDPCLLHARRVDLDMIFRNLLDNAVKYSGDHPAVKVTLWIESSGNVIAQIADNGRGVPEKVRDKIFERFERGGLELERETPGTGLGLYIVQSIVSRMRGRVSVRAGDDGLGSVFEVQLPGGKPIATPKPVPPAAKSA